MWPRCALTPWVLCLACGNNLNITVPELDETTQFGALVVQDPNGKVVQSTRLVERRDGRFDLEDDATFAGDGASLRFVGYTADQIETFGAPDDSPLHAATAAEAWLPPPHFTAAGVVEGGTAALLADDAEPRLGGSWLPQCSANPCTMLPVGTRGRSLSLPDDPTGVNFGIPWPGQEGLAVFSMTITGTAYRITSTSATALPQLSINESVREGVIASQDQIFVTGDRGTLYRATFGEPFEAFANIELEKFNPRIDADPVGPTDVFINEASGNLYRYTSQGLERVWSYVGSKPSDESQDNDVLWLAPGEAVASYFALSLLVHYKDGVATQIRMRSPYGLARVPGFGIVVGGDTNFDNDVVELWRFDPETNKVELLENLSKVDPFHALIVFPLGEGFLYGGIEGVLNYYVPGLGTCRPENYSVSNIHAILQLGDELFITGDNDQMDEGLPLPLHFYPLVPPSSLPVSCGRWR